jgi:hypothetical protein
MGGMASALAVWPAQPDKITTVKVNIERRVSKFLFIVSIPCVEPLMSPLSP